MVISVRAMKQTQVLNLVTSLVSYATLKQWFYKGLGEYKSIPPLILTSAFDEHELSTSRPGRCITEEISPLACE
jgi:hypothetical protein